MQNHEGYISVSDEVRLYYHQLGNGATTIIIPGASLLLEDLRPLAKDYRLIFYDSRGRGQSDRDPNPENMWTDYEVSDLEAIRQHFSLEQVVLLGWSYWGAIASLFAAQYPERVSRMVMICPLSPRSPAPYDDPDAVQHKAQARIDPLAAKNLREVMASGQHLEKPEWFCREFQRVLTPRQMGRHNTLINMKSDPCTCSNEWWHNLREHHEVHIPPETRSNYDWRDQMNQVTASVLVIHGIEDLIPLDSSREWANTLSQAQLLTIPEVGHYPHLEAPETFFSSVNQFLKGE